MRLARQVDCRTYALMNEYCAFHQATYRKTMTGKMPDGQHVDVGVSSSFSLRFTRERTVQCERAIFPIQG